MEKITANAIEVLINALDDNRDGLRQFAIRRLVKIGPAAIPMLITAFKKKSGYIQESAAIVLITLGQATLPALLKAMKHEDSDIRWGATWVLASMSMDLRCQIPEVRLPASPSAEEAPAKVDESSLHGVWSDSWLTKVRNNLEAAKPLVISFNSEAKPLGGTC